MLGTFNILPPFLLELSSIWPRSYVNSGSFLGTSCTASRSLLALVLCRLYRYNSRQT